VNCADEDMIEGEMIEMVDYDRENSTIGF